jgi:hypothetical protein
MSSKVTGHEQLQRITDALDEDILKDLRRNFAKRWRWKVWMRRR